MLINQSTLVLSDRFLSAENVIGYSADVAPDNFRTTPDDFRNFPNEFRNNPEKYPQYFCILIPGKIIV